MDTQAFREKTVVVTGAAQGIGLAIAQRFAREGARVALLDRAAARVQAAAEDLRTQGAQALGYALDVTDARAVQDAAASIGQRLGACDVLVNSAGILLRTTLDDADALRCWRRTLGVNLDGCFHTAWAWGPQLRGTRGCIVNVASIHAFLAVRNSAAYTASKGGVKQLTQALALELGASGVRVNAVAPGLTETAMTQETCTDPARLAAFLARVPLRRVVRPQDVAHAVRFLASEEAACISGVTLPVDGGYCAA